MTHTHTNSLHNRAVRKDSYETTLQIARGSKLHSSHFGSGVIVPEANRAAMMRHACKQAIVANTEIAHIATRRSFSTTYCTRKVPIGEVIAFNMHTRDRHQKIVILGWEKKEGESVRLSFFSRGKNVKELRTGVKMVLLRSLASLESCEKSILPGWLTSNTFSERKKNVSRIAGRRRKKKEEKGETQAEKGEA